MASMTGLSASLFERLLVLRCGLAFRGWAVAGRLGAHQAEDAPRGFRAVGCDVQRSSVKDHPHVDVQLESLILAQNERWRQA